MMIRRLIHACTWCACLSALLLDAPAARPQQLDPLQITDGVPPAWREPRPGIPEELEWPSPPLPDGPFVFESAEHWKFQATVVTRGLTRPWGMAFLPGGDMLITERGGRIRLVRDGVLDPDPVEGVPEVFAERLSGLLDIALHPDFDQNRFVYFVYHKPVGDGRASALARGVWDGRALRNVEDIFIAEGGYSASRLAFAPDGALFMTLGGGRAQDPDDYGGKVLRLGDDGTVPQDNPFVGRPGHKPEIYSMGHRNMLGLAVNPENGQIWASEQGPNGGDEINVIRPGRNYGWPLVSDGRTYAGPWQSEHHWRDGMERALVTWSPSIALSGMTFYTGDRFPGWRRNVFVGGQRQGEIPRTGHIQRIVFNENWEEIRREPLLRELRQRIRDVRQGPDGYIYVLTDEDDAALLRLEPLDPGPNYRPR